MNCKKQENEKIGRNIADAAEKLRKAKKTSSVMRIFGWIAVALTTVAAAITGGVLAFSTAALAVAVGTLTETGIIDKMTQAIAKSRDGGESGQVVGHFQYDLHRPCLFAGHFGYSRSARSEAPAQTGGTTIKQENQVKLEAEATKMRSRAR